MRIGIDGHFLGSKTGGNETLTESLLCSLLDLSPQHQFVVFYTHGDYHPGELAARGNAEFVRIRPGNAIWRQVCGLGLAARRSRVDVLLAQYWTPFLFPGSRQVQTILDVGHRYYPHHFTPRIRLQLETAIRSGIYRSKSIITISEYAKQTIVESYRIAEDRVSVAHLGVDRNFFRPVAAEDTESVKKRLGLPARYLLYVGNLMPRKNVTGLIRALAILKRKRSLAHSVVVVGRKRWLTEEIYRCADSLDVAGDLVFTGYVDRKDLPAVYCGADLHVLPSFFEGFGLTLLESMACGTPVAAANATSIPEVAGDAALLFDPSDSEEIANTISSIINDPGLRDDLISRGRRRAELFSWSRCAEKITKTLIETARS